MERELWSWLMRAIHSTSRSVKRSNYHTHSTATIVRVYLWAILHDRPVYWACDPRNWDAQTRPSRLPNQSTMSRRLRRDDVKQFLIKVGNYLANGMESIWQLLKIVDGKPLAVAAHSKDPDAKWGRGAGQKQRGYKLHAIYGGKAMPEVVEIHPLNVSESRVACKMVTQLTGTGYLLADANYDDSQLYKVARENNHRLVAPRRRPHTGLGHGSRPDEDRFRSIALLEAGPRVGNTFGKGLMHLRRQIETAFGNLTSFYAGLKSLPPWVRRNHRVELYVFGKLVVNAARIRNNHA